MMKKICFWIVSVIVAFGILPAYAQEESNNIQFTINVPNPEAVICTMNNEPYELVKGANNFDVPLYTSFYFAGKAPWKLNGITDKNGTAVSGFYGETWYLTVFDTMQDQEYTLSLINLDEFRTAQFTINVDDPSLVNAILGGYYTTLNLETGENVIKYDPAIETFVNIGPSNYQTPLYSVKLNGEEVAPMYNSYEVHLSEDCVIDIVAILPDEDHTVNFSYSEGAEGSISLSVNNETVTDWDGKSIVVKLGDYLTIYGNTTDYKFEEVSVNGNPVDFQSSSNSFAVMEDTEVYINAHPYGNLNATIIIPNPDLITIYKGYSTDEPLPMQQGENIVELPESNAIISWAIDNMAILNQILLNGEEYSSYSSNYFLKDGDVIEFIITEKVFDKTAVVWIDNVKGKACSSYIGFSSTTDHTASYTLENGYNMVSFYEQMNPFTVSWFGQSDEIPSVHLTGKVYLNGELLTPVYENSTTYNLDLANDDVLKLFMDSNPVECKVAFDIAEGVEVAVVKDIVTVVENPASGFDCFAGTVVSLTGKDVNVSVNGSELTGTENEEGETVYTFEVAADTTVAVTAAGGSAVSAITVGNDADIYNMQGVKVGKQSQLNTLTPGIYIINGKKAIVR